jgi:hypothetical protein
LRNTLHVGEGRTVPLVLAKSGAVRVIAHYAHGLEDRCVGNDAALGVKISDRLKMHRKVYSWAEHWRCTICDNVTVRSPRRRTAKKRVANAWLAHQARQKTPTTE